MKKNKTQEKQVSSMMRVDPKMRDWGDHPYFQKKLADAKEFLKKAPIPEELIRSIRNRNT